MKSKQLSDDTYVLVFDKGDEAMSELERFAEEHELGAGHFTGIGVSARSRSPTSSTSE